MDKLGVGIIGCGAVFGVHADAVEKLEIAKLAAVADIREDAVKEAAARYGCDFFTDYRELLKNPAIQAVHICTPHHLHASMAIDALRAGKHVLTEKPVAIDAADAAEMVETARTCGKHLAVCFQNRFNPTSVKAREVIDSGMLGKVKGIGDRTGANELTPPKAAGEATGKAGGASSSPGPPHAGPDAVVLRGSGTDNGPRRQQVFQERYRS